VGEYENYQKINTVKMQISPLFDPVIVWNSTPRWLKGVTLGFVVLGCNPLVGLPGALLFEG
jgi:hypothetical protein